MMDINGLSSLAHKLEDLFSYYREIWTSWSIRNRTFLTFCLLPLIYCPGTGTDEQEDYAPGDTSVLEQMTDDFLGHVSREEETGQREGRE